MSSRAKELTTVTFDLWETLIRDSYDIGSPRMKIRLDETFRVLSEQGYKYTTDHIAEAYRRCQSLMNDIRKREGDATFDEQVGCFLTEIEAELPKRLRDIERKRIATRYADSYLDHPPRIDEHAIPTLSEVKRRGYKTALICNTGSTPGFTQREFLEKVGIAKYFDTMVFSDEERLSKPAPAIFKVTLDRIASTPGESVHIGDHPRNDVLGAKRAGLKAIWLKRKDEPLEVKPDAEIDSLDKTLEAIEQLAV